MPKFAIILKSDNRVALVIEAGSQINTTDDGYVIDITGNDTVSEGMYYNENTNSFYQEEI